MTSTPNPLSDQIDTNPTVMGGKPVIKGTNISVLSIVQLLRDGFSFNQIIEKYPALTADNIRAILDYSFHLIKRESALITEKWLEEFSGELNKYFDIKKLWMYEQFEQVYEANVPIQGNELEVPFIKFLADEGMDHVLFFPEPSFDTEGIGAKILPIEKIHDFLHLYGAIWTNNHLACQNIDWIFTINHEGDYYLSGTAAFVKKALVYLKNADGKSSN